MPADDGVVAEQNVYFIIKDHAALGSNHCGASYGELVAAAADDVAAHHIQGSSRHAGARIHLGGLESAGGNIEIPGHNDSGQNLLECLQCGKCTAGCPVAAKGVGGPRRLIAKILMGMKRSALADPTWLYCISCGTCASRCPVDINMYRVSTALCELADREGLSPAVPAVHLFEDLFLKSIRKYGRVRELKTVAAFNLRTRRPFKDAVQGLALMRKGAVSPFDVVRGGRPSEAVARIFAGVSATDRKGEVE